MFSILGKYIPGTDPTDERNRGDKNPNFYLSKEIGSVQIGIDATFYLRPVGLLSLLGNNKKPIVFAIKFDASKGIGGAGLEFELEITQITKWEKVICMKNTLIEKAYAYAKYDPTKAKLTALTLSGHLILFEIDVVFFLSYSDEGWAFGMFFPKGISLKDIIDSFISFYTFGLLTPNLPIPKDLLSFVPLKTCPYDPLKPHDDIMCYAYFFVNLQKSSIASLPNDVVTLPNPILPGFVVRGEINLLGLVSIVIDILFEVEMKEFGKKSLPSHFLVKGEVYFKDALDLKVLQICRDKSCHSGPLFSVDISIGANMKPPSLLLEGFVSILPPLGCQGHVLILLNGTKFDFEMTDVSVFFESSAWKRWRLTPICLAVTFTFKYKKQALASSGSFS